jgi:uncharacterized protein YciI
MKTVLFFTCMIFSFSTFAQKDSTKKTFLGVLTLTDNYKDEKNWNAEAQGTVGQHFKRLVAKKNEGVVFMAGPTDYQVDNPNMMGIVIFYAKDEKEALEFMAEDPAVKKNIMKAKVHPFNLAVK